ncbi:MAG: hypothetical protein H3C62_01430 [Gemmatimonadaceae bacterium]|nr:hypothetical protein [Gemmatimonadaceae bacterium]
MFDRFAMMRATALALSLLATNAVAQEQRIVVVVADQYARPVPFALVSVKSGIPVVADDSGRALVHVPALDSLRIVARRIGYAPFDGWVRRERAAATYRITLSMIARQLDTVAVSAERSGPLERAGFYDRLRRTQRGAYAGRFITPEELTLRNPVQLTQMFYGETMVRPQPAGRGRSILRGRNPKCAMNILLDGMPLQGTKEDDINKQRSSAASMFLDDLIPATTVAAIEIYGSAVNAPAELQGIATANGCGIIAIWTGARR